MRVRLLWCARVVLLAGPVALAFFAGGYFDEARDWTGAVAWGLVVIAALLAPPLLSRTISARVAIGGLIGLTAWTLLSTIWAPIAGSAYHLGQVAMVYLGGLIAATALLRGDRALRVVEPAVVAGAVIVIGYGLSERLLPGLLHFSRSVSADGRLEQPLTYWNAVGELAAIGLVLAVRLAGDATRARATRAAGTAAAALLGMGLYVSFSRGALFAAAAGIIILAVVAPSRAQWRSGAVALLGAVLGAVAAAPFRGVTTLLGSSSARERDGAIVLGLLVLVIVITVLIGGRIGQTSSSAPLRLPRRTPLIALALVIVGLALAIVAGAKESSGAPLSGGATRLTTLQSNRYDYWRVAIRAFDDEPIRGVGAGGWAVYWLRYRTVAEFSTDAHSLPLQTLAELGVIGLLLLGTFVLGVAAAAALRAAPALAAGPVAGLAAYIAHAPLDWDWEMPALTLVAVLLAGAVLVLADRQAPTPGRRPLSERRWPLAGARAGLRRSTSGIGSSGN